MSGGQSTMVHEDEDPTTYVVVVNHEEQYAIWPFHQAVPAGWSAVGVVGRKEECLRYVREVWTDMRPLSLRRWRAQERSERGR
jgi:MbtH protein